jgi:hypothetical protein
MLQKSFDDSMSLIARKSPGGLFIPRKAVPIAPTKAIYCIGDVESVLKYDILSDRWSVLQQKTM